MKPPKRERSPETPEIIVPVEDDEDSRIDEDEYFEEEESCCPSCQSSDLEESDNSTC